MVDISILNINISSNNINEEGIKILSKGIENLT